MQLKDLLNKSLHIQGHIYNLTEVGLNASLKDDEYVIIPKEIWDSTKKQIQSQIKHDPIMYPTWELSDYNLSCVLKALEGME